MEDISASVGGLCGQKIFQLQWVVCVDGRYFSFSGWSVWTEDISASVGGLCRRKMYRYMY